MGLIETSIIPKHLNVNLYIMCTVGGMFKNKCSIYSISPIKIQTMTVHI